MTRGSSAQAAAWALGITLVGGCAVSTYAAFRYFTAHGPGSGDPWRDLFWYAALIAFVSVLGLLALLEDEDSHRAADRHAYRRAHWGRPPDGVEDD